MTIMLNENRQLINCLEARLIETWEYLSCMSRLTLGHYLSVCNQFSNILILLILRYIPFESTIVIPSDSITLLEININSSVKAIRSVLSYFSRVQNLDLIIRILFKPASISQADLVSTVDIVFIAFNMKLF
jgi:hypothetical protein